MAIVAISFTACTSKNAEVKQDVAVLAPENQLTYELAKRYVHNYEKNAGTVDSMYVDAKGVKQVVEKPNTRAIWFAADRLRRLLDNIESAGGDGVRFYFATYDKIGAAGKNDIKSDYLGHNTLVMVSTWKDGTIHRDYYGEKPGKNGAKGFIIGAPPENRGEMCPPPKNCDSVGATLIDPPAQIK